MPVTVSSPGRLAGVGIAAALFVASGAPVSPSPCRQWPRWPRRRRSAGGSWSTAQAIVVEPDGTVSGCLLPVWITSPGHPELTAARSCPSGS